MHPNVRKLNMQLHIIIVCKSSQHLFINSQNILWFALIRSNFHHFQVFVSLFFGVSGMGEISFFPLNSKNFLQYRSFPFNSIKNFPQPVLCYLLYILVYFGVFVWRNYICSELTNMRIYRKLWLKVLLAQCSWIVEY